MSYAARVASRAALREAEFSARGGGAGVGFVRRGRDAAADASVQCSKCEQFGHYTYQCTGERVYRPSLAAPSAAAQPRGPMLPPDEAAARGAAAGFLGRARFAKR